MQENLKITTNLKSQPDRFIPPENTVQQICVIFCFSLHCAAVADMIAIN